MLPFGKEFWRVSQKNIPGRESLVDVGEALSFDPWVLRPHCHSPQKIPNEV